jgi:hypothetical protein
MTGPVPLTKEPEAPDPEPEFRASLLCWQGDCHMCRMARCWCGCHGPRSTGGER